jgi:hypothetical protein
MEEINEEGLSKVWDEEIAKARYPGYNFMDRVMEPGDAEVVACDEATAQNFMTLIEKLKAGDGKDR